MKDTSEIKRIPLWCAFLPMPPAIIMIMMMSRWAKRGMSASDKNWKKIMRLSILSCAAVTAALWLPGAIMFNEYNQTGAAQWLVGTLVLLYIIFVVSSIVIREIEYRGLVKVLAGKTQ